MQKLSTALWIPSIIKSLLFWPRKRPKKISPISSSWSDGEPPSLSPFIFRIRLNFLNAEACCDGHPPNEVVDVEVVIDVAADARVLDAEDVEEQVEHEADAARIQVSVKAATLEIVERDLLVKVLTNSI